MHGLAHRVVAPKREGDIRESAAGAGTGKTYTIESTTDMATWSRVDFATSPAGTADIGHFANRVGLVSAYVNAESANKKFYRLTVR